MTVSAKKHSTPARSRKAACPAKEEKKEGEEGEEAEEAVPAGKAYEGYQYEEALTLWKARRGSLSNAQRITRLASGYDHAIPKYSWRTSANALPSDAYKNILKDWSMTPRQSTPKLQDWKKALRKPRLSSMKRPVNSRPAKPKMQSSKKN